MKQKKHTFLIEVNFNKPVTKSAALREARDQIYGNFDLSIYAEDQNGADRFRVKIKKPPLSTN